MGMGCNYFYPKQYYFFVKLNDISFCTLFIKGVTRGIMEVNAARYVGIVKI